MLPSVKMTFNNNENWGHVNKNCGYGDDKG